MPAYQARRVRLVNDQDTDDIINTMMAIHDKYRGDYDIIAGQFYSPDGVACLNNIYNFLKKNVAYRVEGDDLQFVKSPSAIVQTGQSQGSDCKNYALFAGGIIDALNRGGYGLPFAYRFAAYKEGSTTPEHVFIVAWPGGAHEFWLDPVPPIRYANDRSKVPEYYEDIVFAGRAASLHGMGGAAIWGESRPMAKVGGGILSDLFGSAQLQSLQKTMPAIAFDFLYLYIPMQNSAITSGVGNAAFYQGWCPQRTHDYTYLMPAIVIQKQTQALQTSWDWGEWASIAVQNDVYPLMYALNTKILGMDPAAWWSGQLGVPITQQDLGVFAGLSATGKQDVSTQASTLYAGLVQTAGNLAAPGAGTLVEQAQQSIANLVGFNNVPMAYPPSQFMPQESDWDGTPYQPFITQTAAAVPNGTNVVVQQGGASLPAVASTPAQTAAVPQGTDIMSQLFGGPAVFMGLTAGEAALAAAAILLLMKSKKNGKKN